MRVVLNYAEQLARSAQRRALERLGRAWGNQSRGVRVRIENDRLSVEGRRMVRRWLSDPALRFAGRLR